MNDRFLTRLKAVDAAAHRVAFRAPSLTWAIRAVSSFVYRLLELVLGARHPHVRTARQLRQLGEARAGATAGKRVLFFTKRGWFAHVTTDIVLAKALQLRGVDVTFFICDGDLSQCDFKPATDPVVTEPLCRRCRGLSRRFLDAAGLPYVELSQLGGGVRPRHAALSNDVRDLERSRYRGYPIGEFVLPSLQRSLLRGDVPGDPRTAGVFRGYVESARAVMDGVVELYDRVRPDTVVVTNGSFFAERIALEVAHDRGIHVVAYERGWEPNTLVVSVDDPVVPFDLSDEWRDAPRTLTPQMSAELDERLTSRATGDVGRQDLWPEIEADGRRVAARLGLDGRPVAVMFTNILWDSAVFRRDRGYSGMMDWVLRSVEAFRDMPERQLVVRVHPAELRLQMSESRDRVIDRLEHAFPDLPENVIVVPPDDPASSYALAETADVVLVYTSTMGLEAAARGKRVVTAGRTHYAKIGFTNDVEGPASFLPQLEAAFAAGRLDESELALARAYAHLFFVEYARSFPWVDDRSRGTRGMGLSSWKELAPGEDPDVDALCALMLSAPVGRSDEGSAQ